MNSKFNLMNANFNFSEHVFIFFEHENLENNEKTIDHDLLN